MISATSCLLIACCMHSLSAKSATIDEISNKKDLEKLLRTRNNVLVLYKANARAAPDVLLDTLKKAADQLKGVSAVVQIDCSSTEGRKICKKEKVDVDSYILKHYSKGVFNRDYNRAENLKSLTNFMKDPTADAPWDEDTTSKDVRHLDDPQMLRQFLTSERKPSLIMFYAPWCGHCQRMKPEYSAAASELKTEAVLAAMDVNKPVNSNIKEMFNITGFPTLYYFRDGKFNFPYAGERTKSGIVQWMRSPTPPARSEMPPPDFDSMPPPSQVHEDL